MLIILFLQNAFKFLFWRKYEGMAMCEKATCAKYSKI